MMTHLEPFSRNGAIPKRVAILFITGIEALDLLQSCLQFTVLHTAKVRIFLLNTKLFFDEFPAKLVGTDDRQPEGVVEHNVAGDNQVAVNINCRGGEDGVFKIRRVVGGCQ